MQYLWIDYLSAIQLDLRVTAQVPGRHYTQLVPLSTDVLCLTDLFLSKHIDWYMFR